MAIYRLEKDKLTPIGEVKIDLEKDLQKITEDNLAVLFGLAFISSEFSLQKFRIDTLAFDEESQSFVIIEYKRDRSFSVVDQGFSYLALLLNNKDSFILELAKKLKRDVNNIHIDWSQSRVLFLANLFTVYQQNAINFKDLPIELWEVKKFNNETILYNQLKASNNSESINTISKNETIKEVSKEVHVYTEEEHFSGKPEEIKALYEEIRSRLLSLDNAISLKPTKIYIGFKAKKNFISIEFQRSQLKIWLNLSMGILDDPKNITIDVSNKGHHGNGDYEINLKPGDDVDYFMLLAKQAYQKNS
ncbi:MAG: hypothetical protein ACD_81C00186G0006 [uncultured bacterium]|uniref:DUF5655 domain-containing protein n=2 Tax=Candidatus Wolfeibacteriota TaxID=1752735 RepID=A0A0G1K7C5_9BACT|nr:MAG: hypothetical protein ACD_81C00186G0006 [uncultured bacterium]KKR12828.1 MAG: hypothetical protein UT41_C0001G0372 [Candidatus Wolfebacteria bacterium GW2011_GWC2_39_22]KKT43759.1 MAG: hypothetical protein UW32_C0001G0351 [Candidatus Wolfebacteria bacterium GW2011_GWE2_44_13]HBI25510.1 hypothetical protein [Candidatus Wolfebacteria bacterium]